MTGPVSEGLAALAADPARAGLFTDFDGSLSEIVDDPAAALPVPGALAALDELSGRLGSVGVLSGRPLSFLEGLFSPSMELAGLYGLERRVHGERADHPSAGAWSEVVTDVVEAARASGPAGVRVESKGLSLTLHYRGAPELAPAVRWFAEQQATRSGLVMRPAKMSVELHPPIAADKGTTLMELAAGLTAVAFIGDDIGDLPAFAALDQLAAAGVTVVRVAVRGADEATEIMARADVVVDGPSGAVALLEGLLRALPALPIDGR